MIAVSRQILCHSCWSYTKGWYYSAINKNSPFVLWFILKNWIRHNFCWVELQHSGLQPKPKMFLEEGHKDDVSPGKGKPTQLKTHFYFLFCLKNALCSLLWDRKTYTEDDFFRILLISYFQCVTCFLHLEVYFINQTRSICMWNEYWSSLQQAVESQKYLCTLSIRVFVGSILCC